MELGVTGAFGFPDFPQPHVLSIYASAGCTLVQVYRHRETRLTADEIGAMVRETGMRIDSIHGHFGDDLDPSSEDDAVRRRSVDVYRAEGEYCARLGGEMVVVHPCPGKVAVTSLDRKYDQLRRSLDDLAREGERSGMRFAFENMPPYHPLGHDTPRLVREVASVGSPHIVFLLDFGHAHMTGRIGDAIRAAGPHLAYTHVHDNDGQNDTHRLPWRGTLPWDECGSALREIGYRGDLLLEVFESPADLPGLLTSEWTERMRGLVNHSGR